MTQRGKTLGYNLLTTYHMPPGEKYAKVSFYELAKWMDGWMDGWNSGNTGLLLTYLLLTNMPYNKCPCTKKYVKVVWSAGQMDGWMK